MARQQQVSTFIVPEPASGVTATPSKGKREPKPFVIVPDDMVVAPEKHDEKLEPHWLPGIDAATD